MDSARPFPPDGLRFGFTPAEGLATWLVATFIEEGGRLENPDHAHLAGARFGVLWAGEEARRQMRTVVGMAEIPRPRGHPWVKARQEWQLREWFGGPVDFLLTFSAEYSREADDAAWCALVEHELYHCAQAVDEWGAPKFGRDGSPRYAIRGHDVEEFVGVVRRYGARAAGADTVALVEAAAQKPEVTRASIEGACGTCDLRVA